jgi:3-oxoadipate enol-lactonase
MVYAALFFTSIQPSSLEKSEKTALKGGHMFSHTIPQKLPVFGIVLTAAVIISVLPAGDSSKKTGLTTEDGPGFIKAGDDKIFYEATGEGPVLVFIHDGIVHSEVWDAQFKYFAQDHRVVRYDRRGYGKSTPPASPYSNLEDLHTLFTALDIDRACLIAASAGGALAIDFTLNYPDKVTGLVLVGAIVGGFSYTPHFLTRGGLEPRFESADPDEVRDKTRAWYVTDDPWTIYAGNTAVKEKVLRLVQKYPRRGLHPNTRVPRPDPPAIQRLGEIKVPALILAGEFDMPDVHAHAGAINAGIPGSRRDVIPKAGHLIPIEQPELFNKAVSDFLAR